jgi:uncharacterized protein with GYD domain
VLDQYAVLGNFDFLTVVEADDEATVTKAVVEIASRGSIKTATYRAIPINDFVESLK